MWNEYLSFVALVCALVIVGALVAIGPGFNAAEIFPTGTAATEQRAGIFLSEEFPHEDGFTYGVVCYSPPTWCNATVLNGHPPYRTIQYLSLYCGDRECRIDNGE